ncbi:MAG: four helix bundle protein [Planctomycetaceae bacterium]|nr:four helix bundle protein [Planctomycetaceae bacterium]
MTPDEMKKRLRAYALRCIRLAESFPKTITGKIMANQLIRCGTSAAANYHAACAGRSYADFLNKLGIVEEEADESVFWIVMAKEAELTKDALVSDLIKEGREIISIVVASEKTAKARRVAKARKNPA